VVEEVVTTGAEAGRYRLDPIRFAVQERQLGTGDAVKAALPELADFRGTVVLLYGDVPLIRTATLQQLLEQHAAEKATVTMVSVVLDDPTNYGRVIRDTSCRFVERIVEQKDCTPEQARVKEINTGIYAVDSAFLAPAIEGLTNDNAQGEYYLTDIVGKASSEGQTVAVIVGKDPSEVQGVNTLIELQQINRDLLARKVAELVESGVSVDDPASCFVDSGVQVAKGARLGANVHLKGSTVIESGVVLEGSAYLIDTVVRSNAVIKFSVRAESAIIGEGCKVGPFAHLRPETVLEEGVKIGNFVETKKAHLHRKVSAGHLSYLGDCEIGAATNIGAGTITCNYDGLHKHRTIIGERVNVGSNTSLVAPVTLEADVVTGAGSVIGKATIKAGSLALTRAPLVTKENYRGKKG
jgi:bifunctional UDP-N-acetylglucosamine pyrophosphorylase/glucosamine-1-phosphate N-acetyltransferase